MSNNTADNFKVLMMINKPGFRYLPADLRFISSQLNWVYPNELRGVADSVRQLMASYMQQYLKVSRDTRNAPPETFILLGKEEAKTTASESFKFTDVLNISISQITDVEKAELRGIITGDIATTPALQLSEYIKTSLVGVDGPVGNSMTYHQVKCADLLSGIADVLSVHSGAIIPLFMHHHVDEKSHKFSLTFTVNNHECDYAVNISFDMY